MRQACSHRRLAKLIHNQEDKIDSEPEGISDDEEEASDTETKPSTVIEDNDDLDFLTSALGGLKVVSPDSILEETICSLCPAPTKKVKDLYCIACKVELRKYEGLEFSTKIRRIVRVLADIRKEDTERKTIVFSQVGFGFFSALCERLLTGT